MSRFPRATRSSSRRRPVPPGASVSRVPKHRFVADDTMPPDHRDRQTCRSCHMVGAPGDAHHLGVDEPDVQYPEQAPEVREFEQRRFGEREDD